jgi:predicted MPP superfamily phosphohydrolase
MQEAFLSIAILLIFVASQLYWAQCLRALARKIIRNNRVRHRVEATVVVLYTVLLSLYFLPAWRRPEATHLTLRAALLEAPFKWWVFGSLAGFAMIVSLSMADRLARGTTWVYQRLANALGRRSPVHPPTSSVTTPDLVEADPPAPRSSSRRKFLEQTAMAVSGAPFIVGAYGLLYGRLDLETAERPISLARLPKAFHGFRMAQLSDIHIGPFMPEEQIRKYVEITNRLKPDLVVLTGDFVTWKPAPEIQVVRALAGLKAPFGVFGCLGNHEAWAGVQASITRRFAAQGIRILRGERTWIETHGERLNLIGVDYQTNRPRERRWGNLVPVYLKGAEPLILPGELNILLSHNPNTFDRAAQLGVDLSIAGHTHGGQITLEYISPDLSPSRFVTRYVRGLFQKPGGQLYVNRGIGTIAIPMRIGSPPEITVFELRRS